MVQHLNVSFLHTTAFSVLWVLSPALHLVWSRSTVLTTTFLYHFTWFNDFFLLNVDVVLFILIVFVVLAGLSGSAGAYLLVLVCSLFSNLNIFFMLLIIWFVIRFVFAINFVTINYMINSNIVNTSVLILPRLLLSISSPFNPAVTLRLSFVSDGV